MAKTVSGRLPDDLVRALDTFGEETGRTRSEVLRELVRRGLAEARLEHGLEAYRKGQASLGKASAIAGLPITVFLDELRTANIPFQYDVEDLEDDLSWADQA